VKISGKYVLMDVMQEIDHKVLFLYTYNMNGLSIELKDTEIVTSFFPSYATKCKSSSAFGHFADIVLVHYTA
jgi:hypothetical protein